MDGWTIGADVGTILTGLAVVPTAIVWLRGQARSRRTARARRSELLAGQSLSTGDSLYSTDGKTSFTLYKNGNMVVRVEGYGDWDDTCPLWGAETKCLTLEPDGWLVLYGTDDRPLRRWGPCAAHLNVQHNAHVVLYTAEDRPIAATDWYLLRGEITRHNGPSFRANADA